MWMILSLLLCIGASACMMRTYDDAQMAMLNATNLYIGDQETDLPVKITTVDNVIKYDMYRNLHNLRSHDAYFVPMAPESKKKVFDRSIKYTEDNRVAFLYAAIDLVCDPSVRESLVYVKLFPKAGMLVFRVLDESTYDVIFTKPEFKDLQTFNHMSITNAKTPLDGIGPDDGAFDDKKSLKLHLVTKASELFNLIQVYKDTSLMGPLMEPMSLDSLLRMRFIRTHDVPTLSTIPSKLVYLRFRSVYPVQASVQYGNLAASHMKVVLDLLQLTHFKFLGHQFYPNLDLLRETYVEKETFEESNLYWVYLGFDRSITQAQLDLLASHMKVRFGVLEESFPAVAPNMSPITMNFEAKKGHTFNDIVVNDFEEFDKLMNTRYDPKKLGKKNALPIVFQTVGEMDGANYMVVAEFYCGREDLIAMLLVRLYYMIAKVILFPYSNKQIQLVMLQPCGQNKYQLTSSFSHGDDRAGTEMILRLQLCIELTLIGMGGEKIRVHPGKVVPKNGKRGFGSGINAKLTISAKDYQLIFEKFSPQSNEAAPRISKSAARKMRRREIKQAEELKTEDLSVTTADNTVEAEVDRKIKISDIDASETVDGNVPPALVTENHAEVQAMLTEESPPILEIPNNKAQVQQSQIVETTKPAPPASVIAIKPSLNLPKQPAARRRINIDAI